MWSDPMASSWQATSIAANTQVGGVSAGACSGATDAASGQASLPRVPAGSRQRGFALLAVLVIVSLLTLVVIGLAHRVRLDIELDGHRLEREQRRLCLASGVEIARELLLRDAETGDVDHTDESWARPIRFQTPAGLLSVSVQDEAGKLDLNGPLAKDPSVAAEERRRMERFASRLATGHREIDQALSRALLLARSMRTRLATLDVLRESARIPREILYEHNEQRPVCVADFVTVVGDGKVNLNTAPASLLASLADGINGAMVRALLAFRGDSQVNGTEPVARETRGGRRTITSIDDLSRAGVFALSSAPNRELRARQDQIIEHLRKWSDVGSRFFGVRVRLDSGTKRWLAAALLERTAPSANPGTPRAVRTVLYEEIQ